MNEADRLLMQRLNKTEAARASQVANDELRRRQKEAEALARCQSIPEIARRVLAELAKRGYPGMVTADLHGPAKAGWVLFSFVDVRPDQSSAQSAGRDITESVVVYLLS